MLVKLSAQSMPHRSQRQVHLKIDWIKWQLARRQGQRVDTSSRKLLVRIVRRSPSQHNFASFSTWWAVSKAQNGTWLTLLYGPFIKAWGVRYDKAAVYGHNWAFQWENFVSILGFSKIHSSMIPLSRPTHVYFLCGQVNRFCWSSISLWIQVGLSIINQDYFFSKFIHYLLGSLESLSRNAHPIFGSRKNQS